MNWIMNNLAETLFLVGLLFLIIEVTVLSFSTIILFMIGASFILTALLVYGGVVDENLLNAIFSVAILTVVLSVGLWKTFKRLQNQQDDKPVTSDLVGLVFVLPDAVGPDKTVSYEYSGITWQVQADVDIAAKTKVVVTAVAVGTLTVKVLD
ncbi:MAG: NfeD family protein [Glaciecola sp.]|jgi:membrane protein implicated in regulation of membrane protease activity